jgi:electron transport complex protein RnfA
MMGTVLSLAFFAGLSLNLIAQFGLGIQEITVHNEKPIRLPFFQTGIIFVGVLLLWIVFSYAILRFFPIFFAFVLFFPLTASVCVGLELAANRFFPALVPGKMVFNPFSAYNGFVLTALILTLHIAGNLVEAVIVSLSFSLGILFSILILNEIRKRSSTEAVPEFLRGKPLILISMGVLSLIFTSTTAILLSVLSGV